MRRKAPIALMVWVLVLLASIATACNGSGGNGTSSQTAASDTNGNNNPNSEAGKSGSQGMEGNQGEKNAAAALREAPMLQQLVQSGALPAVEERLPVKEDIMIEPVAQEIGQYGGDWKMAWQGIDDKWAVGKPTEESLFRFTKDGQDVEPNVAKGYEVNENSTEYTIYLRKGMKWSDGTPFTADDVLFYWEHMLIPKTFGKELYDCYYSVDPVSGERVRGEVTKIDDYSVKVTFKYPHPLFLKRLAIDNKWFFAPAHYYKTILPEFIGEEKALEEAKKRGFEDIASLGQWTGYYYWLWPDRPTLRPWVAKNDPRDQRFVMERNPYYWKTDSEGQQLPYIDRLVADKVEDKSHFLLKAMSGETNLTTFSGSDFSNYTVLKENEAKGNYRVLRWPTANWSSTGLQMNMTYKDEKYRNLFQDIRFREALSVAVDRQQISQIITAGLADPIQSSVPEGLPHYQEGWAQQWAKFDQARANQLLDEIGLKWDAAKKYRTFADGSELTLVFHHADKGDVNKDKLEELLKNYFEQIGLKTVIKVVDESLMTDMTYSNDLMIFTRDVFMIDVPLRPDEIVPYREGFPWYGQYGAYYASNGQKGIKPEGDILALQQAWDKLRASTNQEDIDRWSEEIIKLHRKNQWLLGFTSALPTMVVASNSMRNVPEELIDADEFRNLGHAHPAQFFIKQ